jgi:hypothetical protein
VSEYSEATLRVFQRALDKLAGKLDEGRIAALRDLVSDGQLGEVEQVERILKPSGADDAA